MYEFRHEFEKKEKKFKLYLLLFIISSLIYLSLIFMDFWIGKISGLRFVVSLLFYVLVLYFGLRRKLWAEWFIKFLVWMNIICLIIVILVKILE